MNPASKSSSPTALDPVAAAIVAQLQETIAEQNRQIARNQQTIASYQMHVQKLEEELRLERIRKYGKQSEKLSDLQLELLDCEPAVSSDEIETEVASGPLPGASQEKTGETPRRKKSSIQDGMSFPRIWNASKRSSPARPSSADAASAAPRPGSLDMKAPKCSA